MNLLAPLRHTLSSTFYGWRMQGIKHAGRVITTLMRKPDVFVGPGSAQLLCDSIIGRKPGRLLLVTDAQLQKVGLITPLIERLQQGGVHVQVFEDILPDPDVEQVEAGLRALKQAGCQAVLAVGGGSVMDAAKMIAARATNDRSVEAMMGMFKVRHAPLPMYMVPTTAGTGSEISIGAVITDKVQQRKIPVIDFKLLPNQLALDGRLMLGLPASVTAATGMDALTHAIEAYISKIATSESDHAAREAVSLIMKHLPQVYQQGQDESARQMMAWASFRAGAAMTQAGVGYVHAIAHTLGARYHIPHGVANAVVLPHVLRFSMSACADRLADLAVAGGLGERHLESKQLAERLIVQIESLLPSLGLPSSIAALRQEDIESMVPIALTEANQTYAVPRYMTTKQCAQVYRALMPS